MNGPNGAVSAPDAARLRAGALLTGARAGRATRNSLAVVAAVNDEEVFRANLAASPLLESGGAPLIAERGHACAGAAYNAGLSRTDAEVVVFAHQDVYLPAGWEQRLHEAASYLERRGLAWAVMGVYGVKRSGQPAGRVWSSGLGKEIGAPFQGLQAVVSIDELVIALRRESMVRFDERLPGFHLYGTDIVQTALQRGFGAYVVHAPVVHNSAPVVALERSYWRAYRYEQRKWRARLPVQTCIVPITRFGWPRIKYRLAMLKKGLLGGRPATARRSDPRDVARRLGYES